MREQTRREFMRDAAMGAAAGVFMVGTSKTSWAGANERLRVAIIGIRSRGRDHLQNLLAMEDVEVATVCDVDERLFADFVKPIERHYKKAPKTEYDLRRVMDDQSIDAVTIATPNHWHSLAGIWACEAGKHVYVEKPCSHNIFEGRQLVEAAKKYNRVVQHGTQIRSNPSIREAIQKLHDGVIGEVYMARGLCYKTRDSIGKKQDGPVPEGVHYDLWLGPAPERPFNPNRFHYNWHFMWDYGNGDLGNQGVHQMDVARWGLGVELPTRVSAMGEMFIFDDDKEIPNVITTSYWFPNAGEKGRMLVFEVRPWITNDEKHAKIGNLFYGTKGYMVMDSYTHYVIYDKDDRKIDEGESEANHYRNFVDAAKAGDPGMLNAPIIEGHFSSALCHMGLISARLRRSLDFDPATETFVNDSEANALLTRHYREPFVVPKIA